MTKLCLVFMRFATEAEIKVSSCRCHFLKINIPKLFAVAFQTLIRAFLPNLRWSLAGGRRTAARAIMLIAAHSRKPPLYFQYILSHLLGNSCMPLLNFFTPVHANNVNFFLR